MDIPRETPKAAATFAAYCQLGPDRSLIKLGEKLGKKRGRTGANSQLEAWSSKYHWVERAAHYDAEQREKARQQSEAEAEAKRKRKAAREARREAERERMEDERATLFRGMWAKVYKELEKKINAGDTKGLFGLNSLLGRALDEERLCLGASTQQIELSGKDGSALQVQFLLPQILNEQEVMPDAFSGTHDD
jgi:hypothetical protein